MAAFRARKFFGLLVLIGLWAGPGAAADSDGNYAVKGAALAPCSTLVTALEAQDRRLSEFGGWVTGYLSALNRTREQTFDLAPWQSTEFLVIALANFCLKNPELPVHRAVSAMVNTLERDRLTTRSDPVMLGQGETAPTMYQEVLRRVQQRLQQLGYYKGTPDGLFGPQTEQALQAMQEAKGLAPTGRPDQDTLKALFYPG